eukprot:PLAT4957.2.p1 GENE.PLAT4957.2~~PLAT4957.2.p1  ORF type:complete len:436 (-),score=200.57 PLAT4957.2:50-1267(-)
MSASDAFIVLKLGERKDGPFSLIGRTEVVENNNNPDFAKHIELDYCFEQVQWLRIEAWDKDGDVAGDSDDDLIGYTQLTVAELMGAVGQALVTEFLPSGGKIIVRGEQLSSSNQVLRMQLRAHKLDNKDGFFGKSDPFYTISRVREDGSWDKVWQSEVVMDNLSPTWKAVEIPLAVLSNGDLDRPLRVDVLDYDKDGSHDMIGSFSTSARRLGATGATFKVINEAKVGKRRYSDSGSVTVMVGEVLTKPSLLDYVRGGCEINLLVAIDYTASNGAPSLPSSLHYRSPVQLNQYELAMTAVGSVIEPYDHDKRFPVFGFGGAVGGTTKHCFPLTGDVEHYEVDGLQGVMDAYSASLDRVSLSGPTMFSPILQQAIAFARAAEASNKYIVLLILCVAAACCPPHAAY